MEREVEEMANKVNINELYRLEQTICYCKTLMGKEVAKEEEKKVIDYNNPEGSVVLQSKADRLNSMDLIPKKVKPRSGVHKARNDLALPIRHTADTLQTFSWLKINVPSTRKDIPATLEKLEQRLMLAKEAADEWEQRRDMKERQLAQLQREVV